MRGWWVISVLALAGCGEHQGWNPNYQFAATPYGQYRAAREAALVANGDGPATIPVTLPARSPTPEQIAGRSPVPVPATMKPGGGPFSARLGLPRAAAVNAPAAMPVTTSGPYPGSTPVLVRYAFSVDHEPGTRIWPRAAAPASGAARLCASYANRDAAQIAFLAAGGPQRDTRGMDPDGDGFVCGWDPTPFRQPQL